MSVRRLSSFRHFILSTFALYLSACVYVPPIGQLGEADLDTIQPGVTKKAQVLELLGGSPDFSHERFLVYELETSKGYAGFIIPGGAVEGPIGRQYHRILVEFDEDGLVKRYVRNVSVQKKQKGHTLIQPSGEFEQAPFTHFDQEILSGQKIWSAAYSPDHKYLALGAENKAVIWDLQSNKAVADLTMEAWGTEEGKWKVGPLVFSQDSGALGAVASMEGRTSVRFVSAGVWDMPSGAERNTAAFADGPLTKDPKSRPHSLVLSKDGKTAVANAPRRLYAIASSNGSSVTTLEEYPDNTFCDIELSHDDKLLVTACFRSKTGWFGQNEGYGILSLRDMGTGQELAREERAGERMGIGAVELSDDGLLLAVQWLTHIELWTLSKKDPRPSDARPPPPIEQYANLKTVLLQPYIAGPAGFPARLSLSPDDKTLASSLAGVTSVWDVASGTLLWRSTMPKVISSFWAFTPELSGTTSVDFSPDGRSLAVATTDGVMLANVAAIRQNLSEKLGQ